jgi:hypothetical protein
MPGSAGPFNATVTMMTPTTTHVDLGLDEIGLKLSGAEAIALNTHSDLTISKPIALNTRSEIAITEPVDVNATATIDVKPLAATLDVKPLVFDLRLSLGKIVPAYVRLPYRHHVGLTLFGIELFGFTLRGETQISVQDTEPPPL